MLRRHSRIVGGVLAGITVLLALSALRPAPAQTTSAPVAVHDLAAGQILTASDIELRDVPSATHASLPLLPFDELLGRPLVGPVAAGEVVTATRVLTPSLLDELNETRPGDNPYVASPIRLSDPAQARLVQVGERVDVLAASGSAHDPQAARIVAVDVPVLSVPNDGESTSSSLLGGGGASAGKDELIVIAVDRATAVELAAASAQASLSLVIKGT